MRLQQTITLIFTAAALILFTFSNIAHAAMTISGTRVIFPGAEREQTIRTTNKGKTPMLVQVWVDNGGKTEDINTIKVPFTATPPVYRVEPGKGQSVRLIYNGMTLPQDRESVFWFNLLEIPPVNEAEKSRDRLELAFRTRIKIFYRPTVLKSSGTQQSDKLQWQIIPPARGLRITNPTPYYVSFDSAFITGSGIQHPLVVDMVAPHGSKEFLLEKSSRAPASFSSATVRMINDYGGIEEYRLTPKAGGGLEMKSLRDDG